MKTLSLDVAVYYHLFNYPIVVTQLERNLLEKNFQGILKSISKRILKRTVTIETTMKTKINKL